MKHLQNKGENKEFGQSYRYGKVLVLGVHWCSSRTRVVVFLGFVMMLVWGCGRDSDLDEGDWERFDGMVYTGELAASPSNKYADNVSAALLGQRLFFDPGMSSEGTVACASCHDPEQAFSDPNRFSLGVRGQVGGRHAPPIINPGTQSFFLWDGRADSLWSQALMAIENPIEMDFSRAEVAHYIANNYAEAYESIFGPLPDLSGVPARAQPGDDEWEAMSEESRVEVQTIFSNAAKAIEAYERRLLCVDTKFDRVVRGEETFSELEERGAVDFIGAGCTNCHGGAQFNEGTNDGSRFHNLGLSMDPTEGRFSAQAVLLGNIFNGAGFYSDNAEAGSALLRGIDPEEQEIAAFKTPSLRGVTQRPFFFHDGSRSSIREVLDFYRAGRRGRDGRGDGRENTDVAGSLDAAFVSLEGFDPRAVEAFLGTLACPDVDPALIDPFPELEIVQNKFLGVDEKVSAVK